MQRLTFKDLFSKSFIAMQSGMGKFTITSILLNLLVSFLVGCFIFVIYKKTFRGVLYQKSFNISLVAITMITSLIIMTISENLILSLGMVGALSIVRFRTPIKDPIDLVFIFWALAVGIGNGVGYFNITITGSIFISIVLLIMTRKHVEVDAPYLLVIHMSPNENTKEVIKEIKKYVSSYNSKSKTITESYTELIAEVRLKDENIDFINEIKSKYPIQKATLVAYSGDLAQV